MYVIRSLSLFHTRTEVVAKKPSDFCRLAQLLIKGHKASNSSIGFCTPAFSATFLARSSSLVVIHCCNNAKGDKCWGRNNVVFSLQYKEFFFASFTAAVTVVAAFILTPKVRKTSWWIDPFHSLALEPGCWVKNWLIMQIHSRLAEQLLQSYLWHLFILTRNFPWDLLHLRLGFLFDTKSAFFCFKSGVEK